MVGQSRFINHNKCPTLVGDIDDGEGCACVEVGGIWEINVPPAITAMKLQPLFTLKE